MMKNKSAHLADKTRKELHKCFDVMSSKSNKTVAIINGKEEYDTLKTALPDMFQEINLLIARGKILVDGKEVKLEFFLGMITSSYL